MDGAFLWLGDEQVTGALRAAGGPASGRRHADEPRRESAAAEYRPATVTGHREPGRVAAGDQRAGDGDAERGANLTAS